ncbi:MAG: hypothetical protein FWG37_01330, partial [Clostridia bacterium]|nr:hypothetical protein [Clostridia bacterium]
MRYPIALVLVFMLGALPILMPSEQTVGYDMTTAGVVDESTDVADTPEVDVEAVEISGTLGALETTTIAEDAAVSGPSVDGAEWTARFE